MGKRGEMRKILIPLDGSKLAEQVLPHIQDVFGCGEKQVHLLSIAPIVDNAAASVMLYPLYVHRDQLSDEQAERNRIAGELRLYLQDVATRLQDLGAQVECTVKFGSPADEILVYALQYSIDLIAMCTHGRSGLARWAYGSVADRVLREASCPVLLVRARSLRS